MDNVCKRCLLFEAGEKVTYSQIMAYLETVPVDEKVDDILYRNRLSFCRECDYLLSGMCIKCGCYVEVRTALKNKSCPDFNNPKW